MIRRGTAVITGAAGGIGTAFAQALAQRGHDLILVDKDRAQLEWLSDSITEAHGIEPEAMAVDLTDRAGLRELAVVVAASDDLEILVNNAGFGNPGPFAQADVRRAIDMIDVHVVASTWLCRVAVPGMISRGKGSIINVSSLGGLHPGPGDVAYGSTKCYLVHFSRCLQAELKQHHIKVQALCPGFTRSGFHSTADYTALLKGVPGFFWMDPDEVAARSLAALRSRRVVCIPGSKNQLLRVLMSFPIVVRAIQAVVRRLR